MEARRRCGKVITMTLRRVVGFLFGLGLVLSACGDDVSDNPVIAEAQAEIDVLLETEDGRGQLAATLSVGSPLTFDEAECFVDNSSSRDLAGLIALGAGEAGININEVLEPIRQSMESCGVQLESFGLE